MSGAWRVKDIEGVDLIGPFECPDCNFHIGVDATYLEQVGSILLCPVPECNFVGTITDEPSAQLLLDVTVVLGRDAARSVSVRN